ncbi:MAG: OB-fold nucleic acid binding domain-containing protein, partial [Bacteroidota bacterium]
MQLTDQEIARRENLQKIQDLGFDPFPAEQFAVDFQTTDYTTAQYHSALDKILETLQHIGPVKATALRQAIFAQRFNAKKLLQNEEVQQQFGLEETVTFDASTKREPMSLSDFLAEAKTKALGKFQDGQVTIAGRFMGQRGPFAKLQDSSGRMQLYIGKKDLGHTEEEVERYKKLVKLLDIGDFIGVRGELFATGTGELSLHVRELTFLSKSLRPLPVVKRDKDGNIYDAFTDPELRYRQRYIDLVVNPQVKETFIKRSRVISAMR